MKSFNAPVAGFLLLCAGVISSAALAAPVESVLEKAVNLARVVKVVNMVTTPGIMVNVSVVDRGGSTDVSPTQSVFLNLYSKGEMFSTDAVFPLGDVLEFKAARRTAAGMYQVDVIGMTDAGPKAQRLTVDARQATASIQAVRCEDEFDCEASETFSSTIDVVRR